MTLGTCTHWDGCGYPATRWRMSPGGHMVPVCNGHRAGDEHHGDYVLAA